MALNAPPPYTDITGISRAVMKDNAQETLANYNGNARPGELVVDLTQDPPPLYVGNNLGQLTLVTSGGGGGLPLANGTSNFNIATASGNVTITVNGGEIWTFDDTGNLTTSGAILVGDSDSVIQQDGDDLLISHDNEELVLRSVQGRIELQADNDVVLEARSDGEGDYLTKWIATQNNEFTNIVGDANVIAELGNLNIQGGRDGLASGNVIITAVNNGVAVQTWQFSNTGTLTAPGNIVAGNIGVSERITCQTVVTDPVNLSSLTAVFGARAFILDGNLAAAGNFGAQISGGGGNAVPVWSDGTNWYVG